jgi:hypothetical protein
MGSIRRAAHETELPLRLTVVGVGKRGFRYLIRRNDGLVVEASSPAFTTVAAAQSAGLAVLRRRSLAARLTP